MENNLDLKYWRGKLEEERDLLINELSGIARPDPRNPDNWQAVPPEAGAVDSREDVADRLEEQGDREATATQLEKRLLEVKNALARIEDGSYGLCATCQTPISQERLTVNPAARACRQHMDGENAR